MNTEASCGGEVSTVIVPRPDHGMSVSMVRPHSAVRTCDDAKRCTQRSPSSNVRDHRRDLLQLAIDHAILDFDVLGPV
jgi:hypothetical protein